MQNKRRTLLKAIGGAGAAAAAQPYLSFPAIAQNTPLRVGIIAPKAGIVGTIGECGLRGTQFAVERINAVGRHRRPQGRARSSRKKPIRRIRSSGCASSCCRTRSIACRASSPPA